MAIIAPFNGLRFNTDVVGDLAAVTAPPYDIISPAQQKELYEAHPFNVIRLENGEEFPDDDDNHNKYTRSAEFLEDWMQSEVLRQDFAPSLYIYGQKFTLKDGRTLSYKGIMCLVHLEEFEKKIILPHEETLSKAKTDRLNLMRATGANFSPIYSLFNDNGGTVSEIIRKASADEPQNCFVSADKVTQSLWQISDGETIARVKEAFASKQLFIADGHHRYETALNFRNEMIKKNPNHTGKELYNYVMMFLVSMEEKGLVVFPTHRLVRNVPGFDETAVTEQLSENFDRHGDGKNLPGVVRWVLSNLLLNCRTRPDFIAYRFEDRKSLSLKLCRGLYGAKEFSWTIRSKTDMDAAEEAGALVIFEQFDPRGMEK